MTHILKGAALAALALATVPASAATTFTGTLGATGATAHHFTFGGGALQINVNASGVNPNTDPMIWVFEDNGSPDTALTGATLGVNDDFNGLNSQLNLNLSGGAYILSVGRWVFSESEARSTNAGGFFAGTTYDVIFDQTVGIAGAVPEPATWALLILGFGAVGAGMRRRTPARVAYA